MLQIRHLFYSAHSYVRTYVLVEALNSSTDVNILHHLLLPLPPSSWSSHHGPCIESTLSSGYLVRTASSWVVEEASRAVVKVQSRGNKSQGEGSSENLYSTVEYRASHIQYVRICMLWFYSSEC